MLVVAVLMYLSLDWFRYIAPTILTAPILSSFEPIKHTQEFALCFVIMYLHLDTIP